MAPLTLMCLCFPSFPRLVFGLTAASLTYVLFVLPVAIANYRSPADEAIGKEWYGTQLFQHKPNLPDYQITEITYRVTHQDGKNLPLT